MREKTAKRLEILQTFVRPGLEAAALEIAISDKYTMELRFAAMNYIKSWRYRQAFDRLFSLANSNADDEELRLRALLTCASLEPLHPKIAEVVASMRGGPDGIERSLRLAAEICCAPGAINEHDPERLRTGIEEERLRMAEQLLERAFLHKAYVVMLKNDTVALMIPSTYRPREAVNMSQERFSQFRPYWTFLEKAAARGNLKQIEWCAPRSAFQQGLHALRVKLANVSWITVSGSRKLDGTRIQEVELTRSTESEIRRSWELTALGIDKDNHDVAGQLSALGGGGFKFALPKGSTQSQ